MVLPAHYCESPLFKRISLILKIQNVRPSEFNLFFENQELVSVAEALAAEFEEQLASRGYKLARFRVSANEKKIDDFNRFDAEILGGEEALIDLQA